VITGTVNTNRLTNADNLIRGRGAIGGNSLLIDNSGVIESDEISSLTIDATDTSTGLRNFGTLRAVGPAGLIISAGPFTNAGLLVAEPGSKIVRTGAVTQTAGTCRAAGTITINSGSLTIAGGLVEGDGQIAAAGVIQQAGIMAPGLPIGTLTVQAPWTQVGEAELEIEVGGPSAADRLAVVGTANLGGPLHVRSVDGYVPTPGSSYTILTATTVVGTFSEVRSCDPVSVTYGTNSVLITFGSTSGGAGDINGDGFVDALDIALLLGSWGPCVEACCSADLNDTGEVDSVDLAILLGAWG
jgi:hypothetical protein